MFFWRMNEGLLLLSPPPRVRPNFGFFRTLGLSCTGLRIPRRRDGRTLGEVAV